MPTQLATLVYLAVVVWLIRRDVRERPNVTAALWLPFCWVIVGGTRFISEWLGIFGLNIGGTSVEEGSPIDALGFFIIIAAGVRVLFKRQVRLVEFIQHNRWVMIYLAYCLVSIIWSDFPLVATKRWIKLFGQPVMVLVLLTEPDPVEAFIRLLKRFAYLVVPISILFIKYFPEYGRNFDSWTGMPVNTGITTNKNSLGCICYILELFFIWYFFQVWQRPKGVARRNELILCLVFSSLLGWLLYMAHSSTSVGALVLAAAVILFLNLNFFDQRRFSAYVMGGIAFYIVGVLVFNLDKYVIAALGRNETLTDRTIIWDILLHWDGNPVLGTGFESFWLGERPAIVSRHFSFMVNEAHNGYLETYIQLGLLGLFLTVTMLLATYFKSYRVLLAGSSFGRFRLAYLFAFIVYNWTEAAFRTHCFPFFVFFLIAIDYPTRQSADSETQLPAIEESAAEMEQSDAKA